ncbi:hypothetical protein SAMN05216387_105201 [Nitrosovibrio tenuis]|uniref:Glycosaminoglycan attachment site n=2 Tax=Nitrosovibrio tenuis TaxID=1233 RepID=A0A1H7MUF9_9PROT|nr:hypothetical protein SAMN05216387_105201 [Nitrosovibrio tenuis]
MLRAISKKQFDAYCYVRQPIVRVYSREIAWFEAVNRKLLAFIVFDCTDSDFGHIILGRDSRKLFRCISVSGNFFATSEEAYADLETAIIPFINDGQDFYPQGDEVVPPHEIFSPFVKEEKQHPYFKMLANEERFEAARNLIKEIAYSFVDVDGNYIQQFQSDGFDARLWELYLYVYLYNAGFEFIRDEVEIGPDGQVRSVFLTPSTTPTIKTVKSEQHTYKHKTIPSKFFKQPNSENVSAVLYSNAATITTFNRMGKLAGLGSRDIKMIRQGMKAHPDPSSFHPIPFAADVDDPDYEEAWGDSIVMYHNPDALHPVDPFPDISHIIYDEATDEFSAILNPNEIFSSVTFVLVPTAAED